jgi:hypothetical protein
VGDPVAFWDESIASICSGCLAGQSNVRRADKAHNLIAVTARSLDEIKAIATFSKCY